MTNGNAGTCPGSVSIKQTFAQRPDFDPPRSSRRGPQSWTSCRNCSAWYAAPDSALRRNESVYCSSRCAYEHFKAIGKFKGEHNPNWLGGVSNDNMRYQRRQREREPVQTAARHAVNNALRSGKLTRLPCEVCGATKSEGHHDDYSKPLDVRWLCRRHHVEHHKKLGDAENGRSGNKGRVTARRRRVAALRPSSSPPPTPPSSSP